MALPSSEAKRYLHEANKHHELPKGMMYFSG